MGVRFGRDSNVRVGQPSLINALSRGPLRNDEERGFVRIIHASGALPGTYTPCRLSSEERRDRPDES